MNGLTTVERVGILQVALTRARFGDQHHIEVLDVRGESLLAVPMAQAFTLASRLIEVALLSGTDQGTIEGMLSVPAVTAADLATAYEMGRRAGTTARTADERS